MISRIQRGTSKSSNVVRFQTSSLHPGSIRWISSTSTLQSKNPQEDHEGWQKKVSKRYSLYKKFLPQALMVGGGLVTIYGTSRLAMYMTSSLMSWNFTDVAYMGFLAGLSTGFLCSGMAYAAWRMSIIRPEVALQRALGVIRENQDVQRLLGYNIQGGHLRAYTIRNGGIGLDDNSMRPKWLYPRVQMLCQVTGSQGTGMTTIEAVRRGRYLNLDLVTVDIIESKAASPSDSHPMLMITGSEDRLKVRGQLRGFLQTERVKYITQNKSEEEHRE
eukprot:gb/GECG01004694.1/.p1 GENE.gb/GECG01004694.1/~~gb/GECG01004694.1/.p1  ORF type:complete len:274 (+),score=26.29 gb/GECG01004694.1/:1-822(+)